MSTKPGIEPADSLAVQHQGANIDQKSQDPNDAIVDVVIALFVAVATYFLLSAHWNVKSDYPAVAQTLPSSNISSQANPSPATLPASQPTISPAVPNKL